jgi:uncharacterized protein (DUF305 family)
MRVGKTVCLAVVLVAGCGGSKPPPPADQPSANVVQGAAPGEPSRTVVGGELAAPPAIEHGEADVAFMQGMIHHHQQAIVMTGWVPERTKSTSVRVMAKRMEATQQSEIEVMQRWLKDRGVDPLDHSHKHVRMPGMLSTAQLDRLRESRGRTFDRRFLTYMTQHHQGALTMVQDLLAQGGGAEAEIGSFTRHVDSDQQIEIQRMQKLLEASE